jgi:hypothetical protein
MIAVPDRTISLPDGRYLGFAEYGAPAGKTVATENSIERRSDGQSRGQ